MTSPLLRLRVLPALTMRDLAMRFATRGPRRCWAATARPGEPWFNDATLRHEGCPPRRFGGHSARCPDYPPRTGTAPCPASPQLRWTTGPDSCAVCGANAAARGRRGGLCPQSPSCAWRQIIDLNPNSEVEDGVAFHSPWATHALQSRLQPVKPWTDPRARRCSARRRLKPGLAAIPGRSLVLQRPRPPAIPFVQEKAVLLRHQSPWPQPDSQSGLPRQLRSLR